MKSAHVGGLYDVFVTRLAMNLKLVTFKVKFGEQLQRIQVFVFELFTDQLMTSCDHYGDILTLEIVNVENDGYSDVTVV